MSGYLRDLSQQWERYASASNKSLAHEMIESYGKDIEFLHIGVDSSKTPSGIRFLHRYQLYAVFGIGKAYNADGGKIANIPLGGMGLKRLALESQRLSSSFPDREAIVKNISKQIEKALVSLENNAEMLKTFNPRPQGQALKRA